MFNNKKKTNVETEQHSNSSDTIANTPKKDGISFIILMGLVLFLPVFFVPFPSFSFLFSKSILISLAVILMAIMWIVARLKDGEFPITKDRLLLTGILIPIFYLVSALFSGAKTISFFGQGFEVGTFMFVLVLFLLMFLVTSILRTNERVYYLFFIFFISFFVVSVIQIARLFMGPEFLSFGVLVEPTSNLIGKWNELAVFSGLAGILSLITIEFINNSKVIKILSFILLVASLFFLALVNFSTVWWVIGGFSFLLISFVISSNRFKKNTTGLKVKRFPVFSIVVLGLSLIFLFAGPSISGKLTNTFKVASTEVRPSWQGTFSIAKETIKDKSTTLIGVGPNRFVSQWLLHKPVGVNETVFWNTDFNTGISFLFTSIVTVGLLGFLLWIVFLGTLFYRSFKTVFSAPKGKAEGYLLPLTFLATVYLWLFSIFYVPSNVIMTLTFIFTGALISMMIQSGVIKVKSISFSKNQRVDFILVLVLIFLVLMSVIGGYTISQKFVASAYSQKGLIELNSKEANLTETETNIIKAINISKSDSYYRFLSEINLVKLQGLLSKKDVGEEELKNQFQAILSSAVQNAIKATEIDKTNYQNWLSLGRVYETVILFGVQGAYEQAEDAYIKAVNLNPKNPLLMLTLGVLEYNNKNYEGAVTILENAVILKPTYSDAKYFLGLTYYNLGRNDDAIAQFEDVSTLNPDSDEVKTILKNLRRGKAPLGGLQGVATPVEVPDEEAEE